MELTASNIATCMIATTRCPAPGAILGVTNVTAFSFQSVITLAKAGCAAPIRATANSPLQRLEYMLRSSGVGNPRVRIAAVTLSERAFGVNEPDGSPFRLGCDPTGQSNSLCDVHFFYWVCGRPNDPL